MREEIYTVVPRGTGSPDYSLPTAPEKTIQAVLDVPILVALATTALVDCTAVDLHHNPARLAVTVEATYHALAGTGVKVHVLSSYDGVIYDTVDWDSWNVGGFVAGATVRQTKDYETHPYILKVRIENLDAVRPATDIKVTVTYGP
jgi:hypothetical protein